MYCPFNQKQVIAKTNVLHTYPSLIFPSVAFFSILGWKEDCMFYTPRTLMQERAKSLLISILCYVGYCIGCGSKF